MELVQSHADGYLPINRACWGKEQRRINTVKVFLEHGVTWDVKCQNGRTCDEMTKNKSIKKLLKKYAQLEKEKNASIDKEDL